MLSFENQKAIATNCMHLFQTFLTFGKLQCKEYAFFQHATPEYDEFWKLFKNKIRIFNLLNCNLLIYVCSRQTNAMIVLWNYKLINLMFKICHLFLDCRSSSLRGMWLKQPLLAWMKMFLTLSKSFRFLTQP